MSINPQPVTHASVTVHRHETGLACVDAGAVREPNTVIVIGVDRIGGTLAIDVDVQADVHPDRASLANDLRMIAHLIEAGS